VLKLSWHEDLKFNRSEVEVIVELKKGQAKDRKVYLKDN
jgi:hypothetical protein